MTPSAETDPKGSLQQHRKLIFLSHASQDREAAERLASEIEDLGIPCWMAPRDVPLGANFGEAIVDAIESTQVFVVLLSAHANGSIHVANEIERAVNYKKTIIPLRLEDVKPSRAFELHLSTRQWVDLFESEQKRGQNMRRLLNVLRDALRAWLVPDLPPLSKDSIAPATSRSRLDSEADAGEKPVPAQTRPQPVVSPGSDRRPSLDSSERETVANLPAGGELFRFGETKRLTKNTSDSNMTYFFHARENDVLMARVETGHREELIIEIRDPSGSFITTSAGYQDARIDAEPLSASGLFSITFGTLQRDHYAVLTAFLQRANEPGLAKTIQYGKSLPGSISVTGGVNTYVLYSRAGDSVKLEAIKVSSEALHLRVHLYDPDGCLVESVVTGYGSGGPEVAVIQRTIGTTGTHTIMISCAPGEKGPYKISAVRTK